MTIKCARCKTLWPSVEAFIEHLIRAHYADLAIYGDLIRERVEGANLEAQLEQDELIAELRDVDPAPGVPK